MKDLFDLSKYENDIADALLLELEVLGGDAKRDLVEEGAHRCLKSRLGEDVHRKSELAAITMIHGMMVEMLGRKMMAEHGDRVRMTRIGRFARRVGYEKATTEKKTTIQKIKEINEVVSVMVGLSTNLLKIIVGVTLLLAILGIVSLSSSTIELLRVLL